MQQLEKGQILEGTVSGLAPFGAFVDIGVGRDGLVHISELTEGRIEKVEDAVKVGDKVTVRVLEIDPGSKRISLTLRLEDRPREEPAPRPEISSEPRQAKIVGHAKANKIAGHARIAGRARIRAGRGANVTRSRARPRYTPQPTNRRRPSPATRRSKICSRNLVVAVSVIVSAARMSTTRRPRKIAITAASATRSAERSSR